MNRKSSANRKSKLSLCRETLRPLTPTELKLVAGGGARYTARCN